MKIGIFGGSFNPIHKGHMHVATSAMEQFDLDEIILMPSYHSPNKAGNALIDSAHRLKMCEIVALKNDKISVSDYEVKKEGVSYTYLTLEHFSKIYEKDDLYFIMGADSIDYLEEWRHPELICKYAKILVIPREGFDHESLNKKVIQLKALFPCEIYLLNVNTYHASSTQIRQTLSEGSNQCPEGLDESVFEYIKENGLYGK